MNLNIPGDGLLFKTGGAGISSFFLFVLFWCGGFGSFRLLVFLLNYCWGGGFKNFKLFEKIQKCFAVFADIWTESYIQFGFIVRVSLHLKRTV